jgi:hypothetical protein
MKYFIVYIIQLLLYKLIIKILSIISKNNKNYFNDDCSICLEPLNSNIFTTKCNHIFHNKCIEDLKNNNHYKCPLCRNNLY